MATYKINILSYDLGDQQFFCYVVICFNCSVFFNALLLYKDLDYVLNVISAIPNSRVCGFMLE
jgi:hypothetical protein